MTGDPVRLLAASLLVLAWTALCIAIVLRERARRRADAEANDASADAHDRTASAGGGARDAGSPVLVAYASQTGTAERFARQTAGWLRSTGLRVTLMPLGRIDAGSLAGFERAAFVVSTCGEGDPPDDAIDFVLRAMNAEVPLARLRYAMLALGDRAYANFCGFGRRLDAWLDRQGAQPLFERIDVDNAEDAALRAWQTRLSAVIAPIAGRPQPHGAGSGRPDSDGPDSDGPDCGGAEPDGPEPADPDAGTVGRTRYDERFSRWRVQARQRVNPGSAGEPLHHVELVPANGVPLPDWQAGDLAQIRLDGDDDRPRDYSIASLCGDGALHLLVRARRREDGSPGRVSHHLANCPIGTADGIALRIRPHHAFSLEGNERRPLILIGNGSGFAGLRALLKARERSGAGPSWLVFGERHAAHDTLYPDDVRSWLERGVLERIDRVFSRDEPRGEYVQDRLVRCAERVRAWVDDGAAIYVCGALRGMAPGVDDALARILGQPGLERLCDEGRYRRDVY